MFVEDAKLKLPVIEALSILTFLLLIIGIGIIQYGQGPHIPIAASIFFLFLYGKWKGLSFSDMESALIKGAASGLGAIYIFFLIGMLIAAWMAGGTIPTIMHYGLSIISGNSFYAIVFIITSILGLCIGSSLTTAATLGVAFIGMASAMDISLEITAGAIISGAFLGDKMSPVSDTTNLASETVGVPLFEHIKNMMWTTLPGFIITFILFWILSPNAGSINMEELTKLNNLLLEEAVVSPWSLIPFIVVAILALRRVPALMTLAGGVVSACIITLFLSDISIAQIAEILFSGYVMNSGVEQLDSILTRGGIESMMFSISLVLLALGMGGLLFQLGIIPSILMAVQRALTTTRRLIGVTIISGIGVNVSVGEQYLSILLPGRAFADHYDRLGLQRKTLARVLEDSGTVINPLIPWGVCGVFLTKVLGVATLDYLPFAIFCLVSPVLSLLSGLTGIGIHKKHN
ncbi:Na+/H+ antiporter NhaC [Bacillus massiliglaciei]|uniref:Na+/H+ antiporter NhaC n=1 Tax=Bacillus massiliglaciei TaxID=1816693 RepID=UPI000ABA86F5|nr:Na+/H+ antiporter NhaC [Bacillus massiliglaciei]